MEKLRYGTALIYMCKLKLKVSTTQCLKVCTLRDQTNLEGDKTRII